MTNTNNSNYVFTPRNSGNRTSRRYFFDNAPIDNNSMITDISDEQQKFLGPLGDFENNELPPPKSKSKPLFFAACGLIIVILFCLFTTICTPMAVSGDSMNPTIVDQQVIMVNRLDTSPKFQEIVVFWNSSDTTKRIRVLKRCVGVPGDTIEIIEGHLYRNGEMILEDYINTAGNASYYDPIVLGEDYYFMLGDNRHISKDSRSYGAIPRAQIIGVKI